MTLSKTQNGKLEEIVFKAYCTVLGVDTAILYRHKANTRNINYKVRDIIEGQIVELINAEKAGFIGQATSIGVSLNKFIEKTFEKNKDMQQVYLCVSQDLIDKAKKQVPPIKNLKKKVYQMAIEDHIEKKYEHLSLSELAEMVFSKKITHANSSTRSPGV